MAVHESDCQKMVDAVLKANVFLGVGHVMLYSPYTQVRVFFFFCATFVQNLKYFATHHSIQSKENQTIG
jgi:hypothetical protein